MAPLLDGPPDETTTAALIRRGPPFIHATPDLVLFQVFGFHLSALPVSLSVCEIVGQSDGGLSVLRTFRLLRVLKLVRFMPALRRQLVVLMKTMDNVATFCMLLMLFIFIFRYSYSTSGQFRDGHGA